MINDARGLARQAALPTGGRSDAATALAITLTFQIIASMSVVALPTLAPEVASARGVSPTYVGLYMTLLNAGAMIASLLAGSAAVRYGTIRVSQVALLCCAAGLACCTLPSLAAVACGGLLIGLGSGPMGPASSHLLARTTRPDRMSLVFSVRQTAMPIGGILAGSVLPAVHYLVGWQYALLAAAGLSLVAVVATQLARARFDSDDGPTGRPLWGDILSPVRLVMSLKPLRLLALCSFVFCLAQLALTTYLVVFLTDSLAYGLATAGALLSLSQVAAIGGRVFWGYVADTRCGARRMLAILGVLMTLACLATAALQPEMPVALVGLVLVVLGASAMGWSGIQMAEAARHAPAGMSGQATAGIFAITYVGMILGPSLFGALSGLTGSYRSVFVTVALPVAVVAAMLWRHSAPVKPAGEN